MSKNECYELIGALANIATAVALIFGLFQFCSYNADLKKHRSHEVSDRFFDTEIQSAWSKLHLGTAQASYFNFLLEVTVDKNSASEEINKFLVNRAFENEIEWTLMLNYFVMVNECVANNLCDKDSISQVVKSSGLQFFTDFKEFSCIYQSKKKNENDLKMIRTARKYFVQPDFICDSL